MDSHYLHDVFMDLADYDLWVNHNGLPEDGTKWITYSNPVAVEGKMDVTSCRNHCKQDPHVENICFPDRNRARGFYHVAVMRWMGTNNGVDDWTLKMYDLDGNLHQTWTGRNNGGGLLHSSDGNTLNWGYVLNDKPIWMTH